MPKLSQELAPPKVMPIGGTKTKTSNNRFAERIIRDLLLTRHNSILKTENPNKTPDITARCRILHSILAWPFGLTLSFVVGSWLPLLAVLSHALADSTIPGLIKDGKHYPSHPPLKWIMFPFLKKLWCTIVPKGWPVTYPPEMNWVYNKLGPVVGGILLLLSVLYWYLKA